MIKDSNHSKTISARKAYLIIENIFKPLKENQDYNITFSFSESMDFGSGAVAQFHDQNLMTAIGCKDVLKSNFRENRITDRIAVKDFSVLLIAAYHERQHIQHNIDFLHKTDEKTLKLAIENAAKNYNKQYYNETYWTDLCEIDAEEHGIKNAYHHLSSLYDEQTAQQLIMSYIHIRQTMAPNYFINENVKNIDDVIESFDRAAEREINHKQFFVYHDLNQAMSLDKFAQKVSSDEEKMMDTSYSYIQDGWEQRKYMCILNVQETNEKKLLPDGHILRKQNWYADFDKLPTRKQILAQAQKEANRIEQALNMPEAFKEQPQSPTIQAVLEGKGVLNAILENGTSCNHSIEVMKMLGAGEMTVGLKEKLQKKDFENLAKQQDKHVMQQPQEEPVIAGIETTGFGDTLRISFFKGKEQLYSREDTLEDFQIGHDEAKYVQFRLQGCQYTVELNNEYPVFSYDTLNMIKAGIFKPAQMAESKSLENNIAKPDTER